MVIFFIINGCPYLLNKGLASGSERFTAQIEALTNRRVTPGKAGRPKKNMENAD